jgi:hypothetical protein
MITKENKAVTRENRGFQYVIVFSFINKDHNTMIGNNVL